MVEGNRVPTGDEITPPERDVVAENNVTTADARLQEEYRRTVGFQPQDGTDQTTQVAGYDRSLGYDRIAVGNTALGQRIDNITNLLAMGERSSGNLQDVNRFYGRAQKEADDLFSVAAQNVMKGREDFRGILAAKSPQEVFQGVNDSIQKQAQVLQQQLQQEQDPARQRRLTQLLAMEQDRLATLDRMQKTTNPQELNRLLMYDAFSAQRIDLCHQMMNERDPMKVRQMAEAEMNLHTVQRAPGFTRANYGMLMMRMGQYDPTRPDNAALRAMQDAASVDPEMVPNPNSPDPARRMGDPNFMRVAADITGMRPDDPRFAQAMAPIFNRDINRSPAQTYAGGDVNPNARYAQVQDQPFQPGTDGTVNSDRTVVSDQTQGVTPLVNGKTPFQRVQELAQVAAQQGLTPDVRKAYEACILDSDKGTSPRVAELQGKLAQLEQQQQQLAQQIDAIQKSPEIQTLVQQGMAKLKARPEAEQQQLKSLTDQLQKTQDKQERDRILGEIGKVCPEFVQVTRLLEEKLKPFTEQLQAIQTQGEAFSNDLIGELNQSSATRMEYAEKLMKSDKPEDKAIAKQLLVESVAKAKPEQREAFAQYAQQLGLTPQELQQGLAAIPQPEVQRAGVQPGTQQAVEAAVGERTAAGKLVDDNKRAFDAAQDKAAKLAEMKGSFQKAITDADQDMATYMQLDAAHTKAINEMPAEDKAKFQKMLTETTPAAEREALKTEFMSKYANIVQMEQQMQALTPGANGQPVDLPLTKFEARYEFARASNLGGDDATAKAMMEDGIKTLTRDVGTDLTAKVMEDPGVSELAKKLGVDANALMQAAAAEAPQQTGDQTGIAPAGDLQGTLRVANARMQKGDVAGAKEAYESAIKMVDSTFNPEENNAKIKAAQDALESGNLTPEQRLQKHQEVAAYFNQAYQAFDIRSGYARVLAHPSYNQNAAAEVAFKDAIAAADRVPVEAMKRHLGLLANDVGTFQTVLEQAPAAQKPGIEQAQAFLSEFSSTLNGQTTGGGPAADKAWMNTQINARKDLASFYVRLRTDVDEKGQPLLNSDGTPRYVPDPSNVFKPEDGMKAIDEAKAKYKTLYGIDLDADPAKDPTLAILAKGIYDNSPAELQRKYQNVSRFWDEAKASIPTMVAGTATAILMARYKPLRALIGESAVATWGTSLVAGSGVASVTHHGIMTQVLGRTDQTWGRSIAFGTGATLSGVAMFEAPKLFSRGVTNSRVGVAFENAGVSGLTTKQGISPILNSVGIADDGLAAILKLKPNAALADDAVLGLKDLQAVRAGLAKPAGMADDAFAATQKSLDDMIANSQRRTEIFNIGRKSPVDDFDAVMAAAKPHEKQALLQSFLKNKESQNEALKLVTNTEKYVASFEANGLRVTDDVAMKLHEQGISVTKLEGGMSQVNIKTVGDLRDVLPKLADANPRLYGKFSARGANKSANQFIESLKEFPNSKELSAVFREAAEGGAAQWKQLDVLKALVPEAQAAVNAGRFGAAKQAFLDKQYFSGMYNVGKGTVLKATDIVTSPVKGVYSTFKGIETQTASQIGRNRFAAGAFGGVTSAAGFAYPTDLYKMYGSGDVNPETGKPYEFNFSNAVLRPAWKSETDNIFIAPAIFGGMMAKPGQAILAQAPWANSRPLFVLPKGAWGVVTGDTWNYWGSRAATSMPLLGDAIPAITTNIAVRQFDLVHNMFNAGAGQQYTDALKKTGDQITDESPEAIQKRIQQAQEQQKLQLQQQQQQQQKDQPAKPAPVEQGTVNQPRAENTDLTGGAPQ